MTFNRVHRLTVLAIMVALDVLLTPLFRIEGMAFMSSVVNIIAGTFMTPLYAATMALIVAVIRNFDTSRSSKCGTVSHLRSCSWGGFSCLFLPLNQETNHVVGGGVSRHWYYWLDSLCTRYELVLDNDS